MALVMQVPVRRAAAASGKGKAAAAAAAATKGTGNGAEAAAEAPAPKAVPKRKPVAKTVQEADGANVDSPVVVPQVILVTPSFWLFLSPPTRLISGKSVRAVAHYCNAMSEQCMLLTRELSRWPY